MALLSDLKFIFLDCQTTGANPEHGDLLEIAWVVASVADGCQQKIETYLIRKDTFSGVPKRVKQLTGISDDDIFSFGKTPFQIYGRLIEAINQTKSKRAVIHFARFERPFLENFFLQFGSENLPFDFICTHDITSRLFPDLPSKSLRAVAGYFLKSISNLKRAHSHVEATFVVWTFIVEELKKRGILTLPELENWLNIFPKPKKQRHEYPLERSLRLRLTDSPGIYKMLSKGGDVLYIGKASSLKSRVNSYFRGRKGRDSRKLEMLTQTWNIEVTETRTALEAALLESDEIKKASPPYNVNLMIRNRKLFYFDKNFLSKSSHQNKDYPFGPFTNLSEFETANKIIFSIQNGIPPENIYLQNFSFQNFQLGLLSFCSDYNINYKKFLTIRQMIALGAWLCRKKNLESKIELIDLNEYQVEENLEDEVELDFRQFLENVCCSLYNSFNRTKLLSKLLFANVRWQENNQKFNLRFSFGRLHQKRKVTPPPFPWDNLDIYDYDRMVVLASELKRTGKLERILKSL